MGLLNPAYHSLKGPDIVGLPAAQVFHHYVMQECHKNIFQCEL